MNNKKVRKQVILPALAHQYRAAMKKYYKDMPTVDAYVKKFRAKEVELMQAGIMSSHYAVIVAIMWRCWAREHGHDHLPVYVFLSNRSLEWYNDLMEQATVRLDVPDDMLEKSEMMLIEQSFAVAYLTHLSQYGHECISKNAYLDIVAGEFGSNGTHWLEHRTPDLECEAVGYLARFGKFKTQDCCETYDELHVLYQKRGGVDWLNERK